jgi:dTDP-4-dehydrorhamnose 3,5-epimerase
MPAEAVVRALQSDISTLGKRNGLELAIKPRAGHGIGDVIVDPNSNRLIDGVKIERLQVYPDDRGFFFEVARLGNPGIAEQMVPGDGKKMQISTTVTYPNTIKAIHFHFEQTDLWVPVKGMLQVFLCDLRVGSRTWGAVNTLYIGNFRQWSILIPPGIGHGYKALGVEPIHLVYLTDRYYNPDDEGRIHHAHPDIAYDWELQHK